MNDKDLNKAFETPEPDAQAKQRAIRQAMAEFELAKADAKANKRFFSKLGQGFLAWLRPTGEDNPQRTNKMNIFHNKLLLSGLATSTLVVAGLIIFNQSAVLQPHRLPDTQPVASEPGGQEVEEILVTGMRANKEVSLERRREYEADASAPAAAESAGALSDATIVESRQQFAKRESVATAMSPQRIQSAPMTTAMPAVIPAEASLQPTREYRDRFEEFRENAVKSVAEEPVSTFSIDVDTSSYSFVRRNLNQGYLPTKDAVRVEELINYFDYDYPVPKDKSQPFAPSLVVSDSPWKPGNKLVHIGIKGYQLPATDIPRSNLVFLMDVSGSMFSADRLPLAQQAMELLLDTLRPDDTVAIVVYAGGAGAPLEPTKVSEKEKIRTAIRNLRAGGSTAGAEGIQLAYELAERNFDPKAVNRIFLTTDGDFNVGPTGDSDLKTLVERKRQSGIYLSILGFGMGNYQDAMMQTLAQNGNGVAAYIDSLSEAHKLLVHEAHSTLFPIAKDVKIQVEFNPAKVAEYRLIGYETRALNREDFNNDKVDAGDIGAGHSMTAIYEITPVGGKTLLEPSRYQTAEKPDSGSVNNEYGFLRIRYKLPNEDTSRLIEQVIPVAETDVNARLKQEADFAASVAAFGQVLKGSVYTGDYGYEHIISLAQSAKGEDEFGYRSEFIQLVRKAALAKPL